MPTPRCASTLSALLFEHGRSCRLRSLTAPSSDETRPPLGSGSCGAGHLPSNALGALAWLYPIPYAASAEAGPGEESPGGFERQRRGGPGQPGRAWRSGAAVCGRPVPAACAAGGHDCGVRPGPSQVLFPALLPPSHALPHAVKHLLSELSGRRPQAPKIHSYVSCDWLGWLADSAWFPGHATAGCGRRAGLQPPMPGSRTSLPRASSSSPAWACGAARCFSGSLHLFGATCALFLCTEVFVLGAAL